MTTVTLTEALAEIKTIANRIAKKHETIRRYLCRADLLIDPLDKQGGSQAVVAQELQGIRDLDERLVAIRAAIMRANLETKLTVEGISRSIYEWLIWRKEVAKGAKSRLDEMARGIESIRQQFSNEKQKASDGRAANVVVSVDEQKLAKDREQMETILGGLDGQLSLLNATTQIKLP